MAWPYLRYVLAVAFIVLAVEGLYFMAPNVKQRFRDTLPGRHPGGLGMDSAFHAAQPATFIISPT